MIARMIALTQPAYVRLVHGQLSICFTQTGELVETSLEELGYLIIDHPQISLSQPLLGALVTHNVALVICNAKHHPHGLMLPLHHHHIAGERFRHQINAPLPLKKQLWKRLVRSKVHNQALLLGYQNHTTTSKALEVLSRQVASGDSTQIEAQAARSYWRKLFGNDFRRDPLLATTRNAALNYGYAILRAATARALIGSGLLPLVGLYHQNRYNAYPLADDVMEPYRPFVDQLICDIDLPSTSNSTSYPCYTQ